ncbi:AAA family ATPase [Paenibacillus sp. GCM10023248]|uniref:AAA family ATPase n=1 Tax=Bacillales TaxID=1385 RepID=UPI0023798953|nr:MULTISPECIES: AAA family ATPase [Bacillales]MDD9266949.1 AAA family ATPase [Paenibacillus sp. MAHUQ-63]MDR6881148.1 putative kinase [Bacillus sp. 3255]
MSKLIFFLGPAGAGKTTLAEAWARKHGGAFLDMDTLLRPAAAAIMTLAGKDPEDRDSPFYKQHCRDLGYRITMDAALENAALGLDAIVIGPFTREIGDPAWLDRELARIGAAAAGAVEVKAIYVYLPSDEAYQARIRARGSALDVWKLDNWEQFRPALQRNEIKWPLDAASLLYFDNSGPYSPDKLAKLETFIGK